MRCRYCFARFQDVKASVLPKGHLQREDALCVTELLSQNFSKVTFVGGEPTLCPWLAQLITLSKRLGATTMLVTNGTRLTDDLLDSFDGCLDWVGLSIDSADEATNLAVGRRRGKRTMSPRQYMDAVERVKARGIRFKLNTVVTALNAKEDMSALVRELFPERWKIFQVLPVEGQNDGSVEPLLVSSEGFHSYVKRHQESLADLPMTIVGETNELMTGSYAMVDPAGRFFDNTRGCYHYSSPILEVGLGRAFSEVSFDAERFDARDGQYGWC